jgi:hypothetical protein
MEPSSATARIGLMRTRDIAPRRLREHRGAIIAFHNAYNAYLESEFGNGNASNEVKQRLRAEVIARMPAAQRALTVAGVDLAFNPPPAFVGRIPVMNGLANTAFLHEEPGWRLEPMAGVKPTFVVLLETLRLASHTLDDEIEEAKHRRRNPFYWIDRGLRAALGFPAYLVSLLVPVSREDIDDSWFGTLLKLVPLAAFLVALYFGGAERGWWR